MGDQVRPEYASKASDIPDSYKRYLENPFCNTKPKHDGKAESQEGSGR